MKRILIFAVFAAFGTIILNSCAQELNDITSIDNDGLVTITASFPDEVESKVAFSESTEKLELTWDKDDYLTIVGETTEKYTIDTFDGKVATFKGNPVVGTSFDVILSRSDNNYPSRTYTDQTQTTVDSKDHLLYDAVLKGVSSYQDVKFTSTWAGDNGGTFAENGCMLIRFKMPEDAGYLKTVTLTAPDEVFYTTNSAEGEKTASMTLALSNADMAADNVVEAYIMTSMQEASVSGELTLTVVSNLGTWSKKFTPNAFTLKTGMRNVITLNDKNWTVPTGDGTEAAPYIIRTVDDLTGMAGKLAAEKKYFAMVNDIDMASVTSWIKIENGTPIDFNGNNRTITNFKPTSYASGYRGFIGILNGRLANLTISNAAIQKANRANNPCGIACGYCGTKAIQGDVVNVHVQGSVDAGTAGGVGGLVGVLGKGTVSKCSANITITSEGNKTGGLIGYHNDADASSICQITNSYAQGTTVAGSHTAGGLIGQLHGSGKSSNIASVGNCYSTVSVTSGSYCVGGIVADGWEKNLGSAVEKSIAWNPMLKTTGKTTAGTDRSSGAIVGCCRNKQTMTDNVRRSDIDFTCKVTLEDSSEYSINIIDQNNVSSSSALQYYGPKTSSNGNYDKLYPYHGKAAGTTETVSDVAKHLGWSETIWDLSGDYPQLIK